MKLAIGMPISDDVPGECFGHHVATIVEASKKYGMGDGNGVYLISPVGFSPHDAARLNIVNQARKLECDRLFFMDDDTITPTGGITRLMSLMDEKKVPAISGFYLKRGNPYTPVWSREQDGNWYNVDADGGVHEIHVSGLGCCLLDLKWLDQNVPAPWFQMKQENGQTIITDDVVLFEAIRKAGGMILGDAGIQCPHVGRKEFILRETAQILRNTSDALKTFLNPVKPESVVK